MRSHPYEANNVVHRFAEPERKAWARRFGIAMSAGLLLIPALGAYLLYLNGDASLAAIMAIGAILFLVILGGFFLRYSSIGPTVLVKGGVRFTLGVTSPKQVVVSYGEIEAIRVPSPFQSLRLYRLYTSDGRRFVVDGWIEYDFIERLSRQLGDRWHSVFRPRRGRYPVLPPQR